MSKSIKIVVALSFLVMAGACSTTQAVEDVKSEPVLSKY
jgi:hypothetical protein